MTFYPAKFVFFGFIVAKTMNYNKFFQYNQFLKNRLITL